MIMNMNMNMNMMMPSLLDKKATKALLSGATVR